jgi:hypothetical protein
MAYDPTYDTTDLNDIVVDGLGEAGAAVNTHMPLLILAFVLLALAGVAVAVIAKFR